MAETRPPSLPPKPSRGEPEYSNMRETIVRLRVDEATDGSRLLTVSMEIIGILFTVDISVTGGRDRFRQTERAPIKRPIDIGYISFFETYPELGIFSPIYPK
ncbi:hypothetical protein [Halopelagius fulvigenes]|uniref:hypothetical protein n=1 Tax=Halopelagius fulvigenes TaxID=1198324 RepID=UPI0036D24960